MRDIRISTSEGLHRGVVVIHLSQRINRVRREDDEGLLALTSLDMYALCRMYGHGPESTEALIAQAHLVEGEDDPAVGAALGFIDGLVGEY